MRRVEYKYALCLFSVLAFSYPLLSTELLLRQTLLKSAIRFAIYFLMLISISNSIGKLRLLSNTILIMFVSLSSLVVLKANTRQIEFIVLLFLSTLAAYSLDYRSFVKSILWGNIIGFVSVLIGTGFGLFEKTIRYDYINNRIRYSYGFASSNYMSLVIYSIIISVFLLSKRKFISTFPLFLLFIFVTRSRTAIFAYIILISVYVFLRSRYLSRIKKKMLVALLLLILTLGFGIPIFSPLLVAFFPAVDILLSFRLKAYENIILMFDPIDLLGGKFIEVDQFFLSALLNYGLLFCILYSFLLLTRIRSSLNNCRDIEQVSFLFSYTAYGIMESPMDSPIVVLSILYWCLILGYYSKDRAL